MAACGIFMAAASGAVDPGMGSNHYPDQTMINQATVYRKYPSREHAQGLLELLEENQIEYAVETTAPIFDATFAQNQRSEEVVIKLRASDFRKADMLQEQLAASAFENLEKEYYLLSFTDQELMDIVVKPYEWSAFDYQLAQKLLKERGKEVNVEIVRAIKEKNLEEITRTEAAPTAWIWAGYILSLMGGLLGFFIGWHLLSHSRILPNGQKVKAYDVSTQRHGERIMVIGVIFIIAWLFIKLGLQLFI